MSANVARRGTYPRRGTLAVRKVHMLAIMKLLLILLQRRLGGTNVN